MKHTRFVHSIKSKANGFFWGLLVATILFAQVTAQAQNNCPSGIAINVSSGSTMIAVWSPLSNGDYRISNGWGAGKHIHAYKDYYALDFNMAGTTDLGKAVFLPITGRVWAAHTSGPYGNTAMIWDPGTGIVIRLAHMLTFSSVINSASGQWFGAGTKVGYIGETGCPGCGPHLHMSAYRNVKVGVRYGTITITEQNIINALSRGSTPAYAQEQNFRVIAPSDNCDLIRFDGSPTVYTSSGGVLYPVTFDVWRSWGLSLNLSPTAGTYDQAAGKIPVRVLPAYQRGWYNISNELAWPRRESVFKGNQSPAVYVWRWNQKNWLSANQFGETPWYEYRWSEIQEMNQNFVNGL